METQEALKIVRALANGKNPENDEASEANSICLQPAVIKALNRSIAAMVAAQDRERNRPANAFRAWTRAEDAQVCEAVRKGIPLDEIAKAHNRTGRVYCGSAGEAGEDSGSAAFAKGCLLSIE